MPRRNLPKVSSEIFKGKNQSTPKSRRAKFDKGRKADFNRQKPKQKNLSGKCSAKADRKLKFNFVRTRAVKTLGKVKPGKSEIY